MRGSLVRIRHAAPQLPAPARQRAEDRFCGALLSWSAIGSGTLIRGHRVDVDNFAFATLRRAYEHPDRLAASGNAQVSYQRFADLTVHFARRMREFGVDRSSTIGFQLKSPLVAVVAATAVALLGAKWIGGRPRGLPGYVPRPTHVFAGMGESEAGAYEFTRAWFEAPPTRLADLSDFDGHASADDMWLIAHSSGTTGRPKHMPLTYAQAWRRVVDNADLVDGKPMTLCSLFEPVSYVGIRPRLGNLFHGGTNVSTTSLERLPELGVNRVMGSPSHLVAFLKGKSPPPVRIRSCRLTGAAVTRRFVEHLFGYFEEVQVLYGSTEAGAVALAQFFDAASFDGSAGPAMDGAAFDIVDQAGEPVPTGSEGIVRVRAAGMISGYLGEPELTRSLFRDGWFTPGDLGRVGAAGALYITGRTGEVINLAGLKLNAADLDEVLQLHADVDDGYCFIAKDEAGADVLAAVVSLRPGANPADAAAIREVAARGLAAAKVLKRVYVVDTVLRNENGKPMRAESARAAQDWIPIELA